MEQEERVIPVEVINELLRLNDKMPITAGSLYSDSDAVRSRAENWANKMKTYLENSGLSEDESDEYLYKVQRYNELFKSKDDVKKEFGVMGCSVIAGIIIMALSALATYLLYRFNMYMYNEQHKIWYFAIIINLAAGAAFFVSFVYLIVKAIGDGLFKMGLHVFKKHKKPNKDYMEYATYLMENHNYTKDAIKLYFADYDMEYVELESFVNGIKDS